MISSYKKPLAEDIVDSMSRKQFSDETATDVHVGWCSGMKVPLGSFSKESLCGYLCKFITEVKKVDGTDFPPQTLYDIIICLQFWWESNGYNWKLVSGNEFQNLKYTLNNCMKECAARGIGSKAVSSSVDIYGWRPLMVSRITWLSYTTSSAWYSGIEIRVNLLFESRQRA